MTKRERHSERVRILRALVDANCEQTGMQVAESTGLNRRSIGRKLDSMSLDGLVDARPAPNPRISRERVSVWWATEKGRRVLAKAASAVIEKANEEARDV